MARILAVDNSRLSRRLIREELSAAGYEITEAEHAEQALGLLEEHPANLITLSTKLAGMDGFALCHRIREREAANAKGSETYHPVPVLFITTNDTVSDRERGFAAGATDFLRKPFQPGELRRAVDGILRPRQVWLGLRALVAEDSTLTRRIVVRALHRLGVDVLEARDGLEALELARIHANEIEMIVSDLMMPGLDGAALSQAVRRIEGLQDVPIIMLSAISDRPAVLRLFRSGATDYLVKPFSLEELLARIKVHVDTLLLHRDLAARHQELERDLALARAVQRSALRSTTVAHASAPAICYLPQGQVSGDVYDLSVSSAGALNVFLGDAAGHGMAAALTTMMVQTALDSVGPDESVGSTLARLHDLVNERAHEQFVTGVFARLAPSGQLVHGSAGHPPILHVPRGGCPRALDVDGGMPLGLLPTPLPFPAAELDLAPGDRIYLYSDGIVEWARGDGAQFGLERMLQWLAAHPGASVDDSVTGLVEAAREFAAGAPCMDDVTLIGLEYRP